MSDYLQPHELYSPWNSPGQNTGGDSHSLLQKNLPNTKIEPRSPELQLDSLPVEPAGKPEKAVGGTQGLSPGLPHCRRILYQLSHQGSPRILERVAYPVSIFPTQELNWGFLHCRWILYQLSYRGSSIITPRAC